MPLKMFFCAETCHCRRDHIKKRFGKSCQAKLFGAPEKKKSIYIMSKNKNMSNISIYCVAEITTEVSMLALACHVLGYLSELSARTAS